MGVRRQVYIFVLIYLKYYIDIKEDTEEQGPRL